jgi:hypothetical protein
MKREVSQEQVSMMLRNLPPRVAPAALATSLRVIASRERQRRIQRRGLGHVCVSWLDRTRLTLQDILRPLALPAAGGLFSAVVLFSMWVVPTYPLRAKSADDIPTNLTTSASQDQDFACSYCFVEAVKGAVGVGLTESVLVDIDVDDQGRMVDYQVVSGAAVLSDPRTRIRLENLLWFTKFAPATSFGMPMAGKARLLLLPSRIDVKG